ncbi:hypothetical protein PV325_006273 [Microctonus aethiopoides]|nr:hypothetical protein PV325_006273 [Microctonus aethiopoides]
MSPQCWDLRPQGNTIARWCSGDDDDDDDGASGVGGVIKGERKPMLTRRGVLKRFLGNCRVVALMVNA